MTKPRLTSQETEVSILGSMMGDGERVAQAIAILRPEMFSDHKNAVVFRAISNLYARGLPTDMVAVAEELKKSGDLEEVGGYAAIADLSAYALNIANIEYHCRNVLKSWQARRLVEICDTSKRYLEHATYFDGGKKLADRLAIKTMEVFSVGDRSQYQERHDLLDELWLDAIRDDRRGISMPWQKLDEEMTGPLIGGEVVGMSAFSGGGKSTLAASVVKGICKGGTPTVVFATEMGKRWVSRLAAAESMTSQRSAEKRDWGSDPGGLERYQRALERMKDWPLEVIPSPNISPEEVVHRTRILRQRYPGKLVLVVVDHLHRLDYGREDANKLVGRTTKLFKNFAMSDGNLVFLLLYQPRKPEDLEITFKPVAFHQVRGDAMVGNELDVHISPFRTWVKTSENLLTPWGSPRAYLNHKGLPVVVEPPESNTLDVTDRKLSDEHVFVKVDKRRVGGPGGTVVLTFHEPSGLVTDQSLYDEHQQVNLEFRE